MAATPPAQITTTPETPLTPLHGAAYERFDPRRPTRSSARIASREHHSTPDASRRSPDDASLTTPKRSKKFTVTSPGLHSPQSTPKTRPARRVQVLSPPSPTIHPSSSKHSQPSRANLQALASSSTMISHGMLPTPVKTPKKKAISKVNATARALFQEPTHVAGGVADVEPSPRRNRKGKRYNGYSLESFSVDDEGSRGQIQIFTDSRDRVPQVDKSKSNPFVESAMDGETVSARKITGTAKRRKVSTETRKMDSQVEEALKKDEGMVYVFRGKKVYRRFNDDDDEEEEISAEDIEDLGLLEYTPKGSKIKPIRTLTRRSIKPTRLFQTEQEERARELEKEEEALTDIEETADVNGDDLLTGDVESPSKTTRSLRSAAKGSPHSDEEVGGNSRKKGSPFDTWPRVKSAGRSVSSNSTKGRKRTAAEAVDNPI
ncbi:uncharacterized protein PV06_02527 [Exophiala oligosperma]|uniref:Uncharacterized protein n=1 Tax=Exophiala oligosperma TaxID=215243 RepID=A0A0D2B3V2_9EURO|nr:uncharacterized protein PV06_02527 [Exophiala oligosperma]KIW46906.1 hypothetical protein PV06_02527 [Exophiala oligosperma]